MIRAVHKTGSWVPLLHATCKQTVTSEAVGVLSAHKGSLGASDRSSVNKMAPVNGDVKWRCVLVCAILSVLLFERTVCVYIRMIVRTCSTYCRQ